MNAPKPAPDDSFVLTCDAFTSLTPPPHAGGLAGAPDNVKELVRKVLGLEPGADIDASQIASHTCLGFKELHRGEARLFQAPSPAAHRLREAVIAGNDPDPRELFDAVISGSVQQRALLRDALKNPAAMVRNQDLTLPLVAAILEGDENARRAYQQRRIIIAETLPDWAVPLWEKENTAPWRTFELHGKEMLRFARKVGSGVEGKFQRIYFPPYELAGTSDEPADRTERGACITRAAGEIIFEALEQGVGARRYDNSQLIKIADEEIRRGTRSLNSPTPVGRAFRNVLRTEVALLSNAVFIEDITVALNLPLTSEAKACLWNAMRTASPDYNLEDRLLKLKEAADRLALMAPDALQRELTRLAVVPGALKKFLSYDPTREPCEAAAASASPAPQPVLEAAPQPGEPALVPSRRLIIRAALDTHFGRMPDAQRLSRVIAKLVDSEALLDMALARIEARADLTVLVDDLRAKRPARVSEQRVRDEAPQAQISKDLITPAIAPPPVREPPTFLFSKEATEAMMDGNVRHAVDRGLEYFAERPELADLRKIHETSSTWELRLHREKFRVYFCRPLPHHVLVTYVGAKHDQSDDIPKLRAIEQREIARVRGGG